MNSILFTNVILKVFTFVKLKKKLMTLESKYTLHKEPSLSGLWIYYNCIKPLVENLNAKLFSISIAGYSENSIPIHEIRVGTGKLKIVLWSQMHGDESTATKGIFDILNFISKEYRTNTAIAGLLKVCTLVFVPMLNPDGALAYTRENWQGIDLNRDAKSRRSKEAQILHKIITTEKPNFAFNLHDQTSWYNLESSERLATLSFLSPAADSLKTLTKARKQAMRVISVMQETLKKHIPNQIGRYNDTFCENCFGDSIQAMGFPTILIESGYYAKDEFREETRKFHFIALMSALLAIASDALPEYTPYMDIPMNEKNYYDTRFDNVLYKGELINVGVRYIYKIENEKLTRVIDADETIFGKELGNKFFHKHINVNGIGFDDLT